MERALSPDTSLVTIEMLDLSHPDPDGDLKKRLKKLQNHHKYILENIDVLHERLKAIDQAIGEHKKLIKERAHDHSGSGGNIALRFI